MSARDSRIKPLRGWRVLRKQTSCPQPHSVAHPYPKDAAHRAGEAGLWVPHTCGAQRWLQGRGCVTSKAGP